MNRSPARDFSFVDGERLHLFRRALQADHSPRRIPHLTVRAADARKQVGSLLMRNQTGGRQAEKDTELVCFVVYAVCYVEPGRQCPGSSDDLDGLDQQ